MLEYFPNWDSFGTSLVAKWNKTWNKSWHTAVASATIAQPRLVYEESIFLNEILFGILASIPEPKELCSMSLVCRQWHDVANDNVLWRRLYHKRVNQRTRRMLRRKDDPSGRIRNDAIQLREACKNMKGVSGSWKEIYKFDHLASRGLYELTRYYAVEEESVITHLEGVMAPVIMALLTVLNKINQILTKSAETEGELSKQTRKALSRALVSQRTAVAPSSYQYYQACLHLAPLMWDLKALQLGFRWQRPALSNFRYGPVKKKKPSDRRVWKAEMRDLVRREKTKLSSEEWPPKAMKKKLGKGGACNGNWHKKMYR